jgi:hypothetical protein
MALALKSNFEKVCKTTAAAVLGLSTLFAANGASALDFSPFGQNQCVTPEQFVQEMNEQKMKQLISSNADGKRSQVSYWSNSDGSVGYEVSADAPRGKKPTIVCASAKITQIELFDAREIDPSTTPIPKDAFIKDGYNVKRSSPPKPDGTHDTALIIGTLSGEFPIFQAITVVENKDGKEIPGRTLTLTANLKTGDGVTHIGDVGNGKGAVISVNRDVVYRDAALAILDARKQLTLNLSPQ